MSSPYNLYDYDTWKQLVTSENWWAFARLLKKHKEYLQTKVNGELRAHNDRSAGEWLAKLDDCDKILTLITQQLNELGKGKQDAS